MSPIIEKKETSVGLRLHYHGSTKLPYGAVIDSRLDPQGVLNLRSPLLERAAKDLGMTVEELAERLKNLKEGETIEWQ